MKLLAGKSTLLVAAILGLQQLSSGRTIGLTAPKPLEDLVRRIDLIIPKPVPDPEPVTSPAEPGTGAPHFGGDLAPATPADPPAPPPAPQTATLGTEDELLAMGLTQGSDARIAFDRFSTWFDDNKATNTETPWMFLPSLELTGTIHGGLNSCPSSKTISKRANIVSPVTMPLAPTTIFSR
jgi:hypothetical protein